VAAIGAFVTIRPRAGRTAEVIALLARARGDIAANEAGNAYYDVFRSRCDPAVIHVLEKYRDAEAVRAHARRPAVQALGQALAPLIDGEIIVELLDEAQG